MIVLPPIHYSCSISAMNKLVGLILIFPAALIMAALPGEQPAGFRIKLVSDTVVDDLLKYADHFEIPRPHPDSKLVRLQFDEPSPPMLDARGNPVAGYERTFPFDLGFRSPNRPREILVGFTPIDASEYSLTSNIAPHGDLVIDWMETETIFGEGTVAYNSALITAVNLLRRDRHSPLGRAILWKARKAETGENQFPSVYSRGGEPVGVMLARATLANEINRLTSNDVAFRQIRTRVERIWEILKPVDHHSSDGGVGVPQLLRRLAKTVEHKSPPPTSLPGMVESYIFAGDWPSYKGPQQEWAKLAAAGLRAVPALIELLEDERITNRRTARFQRSQSYAKPVQQVASEYLQSLAGSASVNDWRYQKNGVVEKGSVQEWYRQAMGLGEEEYVKRHAVVISADKTSAEINPNLLRLGDKKYPHLLPDLYRSLFKTDTYSGKIAESLASSPLDSGVRIKVLREAIATSKRGHMNAAFPALRQIDPTAADKEFLKLLHNLESEIPEGLEDLISRSVSDSKSGEVWRRGVELATERPAMVLQLKPTKDAPADVTQAFFQLFDHFANDDSQLKQFVVTWRTDEGFVERTYETLKLTDAILDHFAQWAGLKERLPPPQAPEDEWARFRKRAKAIISARRPD